MNSEILFLEIAPRLASLIPLIMLISMVFFMASPKRPPEHLIALVIKIGVTITFILLLLIQFNLLASSKIYLDYKPYGEFKVIHFTFVISYFFDNKGLFFCEVALGLAFIIASFVQKYLHNESGYYRFFSLFALFVNGMVMVILAGTIETLFIGWEMVGLSSALLVAFFQERTVPAKNALHLWVVYKISDACLFTAIFLLHQTFGEVFFPTLLNQSLEGIDNYEKNFSMYLAVCMVIISAMAKSALVPFSGWLARAMDGPTPSSAIFYGAISIHMGAFLLLRFNPLIQLFPGIAWTLVGIGVVTSILSTVIEKTQCDMKSILAFSTLTQVGIIVSEIGLGFETLAMVHIIGNASLKTYQFLLVPSSFAHYQSTQESLGSHSVNKVSIQELSYFSSPSLKTFRLGFLRGGLDAFLIDWFIQPIVSFSNLLSRFENRFFCLKNNIDLTDNTPKN